MKNRWKDSEASSYLSDPLQLRVYTSRLLGSDSSLVLHGGGNTSVKVQEKNIFGEIENILYVKGSGWDLATIEARGFSPVRMDVLLKMARLEKLSDAEMVSAQRAAMKNPDAPNPSVETILHALVPFQFVDHTHADAVVAVTNSPNGSQVIQEIYGDEVIYIPYVMPGFILARKVFERSRDLNWSKYSGMVLLHHGIFTFANDAKSAYDRMIELVSRAEAYLESKLVPQKIESPGPGAGTTSLSQGTLKSIALLRKGISEQVGTPMISRLNPSPQSLSYSQLTHLREIACQGPLTPDHVLHTKRIPMILEKNSQPPIQTALDHYSKEYQAYFERNKGCSENGAIQCLDAAPRWVVWPGVGILSFGATEKRAAITSEIVEHTITAQEWAERLGGWVALPERDIFQVEYWSLEQAKLKKSDSKPSFQGKIALVTGAASGIGRACAEELMKQGAVVVGLDIRDFKEKRNSSFLGIQGDLTHLDFIERAVAETVRHFGGLDVVVANAGIFPATETIQNISDETWEKTIETNLTSQMKLFRTCIPFLELGLDPSVIIIASKNVPAPGPGAAAYSASKAGLTQLARVLALELAPKKIRVQIIHPHAVMDTDLWTPELLKSRADRYSMTIDEYRKNNLLGVEVTSSDVANLVCALAGPIFSKSTGLQLPIDGGNERVV